MNEKTKQVFDAGDIIKKVGDLPEYLQFTNNACLMEFIKQRYKDARKYDSFFLYKKDGEVKELWGVLDRYPYSTTYAYRIFHAYK
jgi:thioredoxin-related protein